MRKRQFLNKNNIGKYWMDICNRMNGTISQHTEINSKWIKDLNIRSETIKLQKI